MSERYEPQHDPYRQGGGWAPDQGTVRHEPDDWREQTTPGMAAVPPLPPAAPTSAYPAAGGRGYPSQSRPGPGYPGQGYQDPARPAQGYSGDPYAGGPGAVTAPDYAGRPVAFRRPDGLAGLLLVLAGAAAGVSLLL